MSERPEAEATGEASTEGTRGEPALGHLVRQ